MTDDKDPAAAFRQERAARIEGYRADAAFQAVSGEWVRAAFERAYMYNWEACGRPIIQLPADVLALSELIWKTKPDLIIETGIAHGGSVAHSAAQLALLELAEASTAGTPLDPRAPRRRVVAVDIDIRAHNRAALDAHPFRNRMTLIEGPSLDAGVIAEITDLARAATKVMVCLDSMHTHDHVLGELRAYAPLVSRGAHCVVFDTIIEDLPPGFFPNRPWNPGDSPRTAIAAFQAECTDRDLRGLDGEPLRFALDEEVDSKLLLTAAPGGYLRRQ